MSLSDADRRVLWVRAGGRCTLCKSYLLEGALTAVEEPLGEGAHIVGRVDSAKSPRGLDQLPVSDRDNVDNIMLACSRCHTEIDNQRAARLLDADFLRQKKFEHEAEIRHQTGLTTDRRTAVLRMAGDIRGDAMELPRRTATQAVLGSAGRFPWFLESYDRQGVEIALHQIPGEHPVEDAYYEAACSKIDAALNNRVIPGIENGDITHLSVFAIARLPLLIYLGSKLDDGYPVDIYQRHRATDSWQWPDLAGENTFEVTPPEPDGKATDVVLITNLSGTTDLASLPAAQQNLPTWTLQSTTVQGEDVMSSPATLTAFTAAVRALFTKMEGTHPQVQRLHLFGALPLSAAVSFGRSLKSDGLRPAVITYDRTGASYRRALEI